MKGTVELYKKPVLMPLKLYFQEISVSIWCEATKKLLIPL